MLKEKVKYKSLTVIAVISFIFFISIGAWFSAHPKSKVLTSDKEKIAIIIKYFKNNPMIENGASGFVKLNFDSPDTVFDDLRYTRYMDLYNNSKYLGKTQVGKVLRYYFEKEDDYYVVQYVSWESVGYGYNGDSRSYQIPKHE